MFMSEPGPAACSILASKAPAPTTRFNVTLPGIPLIVPPFFASRTPLAALSESRDMSYIPGVGPDTGGGVGRLPKPGAGLQIPGSQFVPGRIGKEERLR